MVPANRSEHERQPAPTTPVPELDAVIIERARAMRADERAQSADSIAQSQMQDALATGSLASIKKTVRQALLRSCEFCVTNDVDGKFGRRMVPIQ